MGMKKSVWITGVPGVGKSTISLKLRELGYTAWDLEEVPKLYSMVDHTTGQPKYRDNTNLEDVKHTDWVCNKKQLSEMIQSQDADLAFYCGSSANYIELMSMFDSIVLLKAAPEVIRSRLRTRIGHLFGKTPEVQDWVLSWKDWWEKLIEREGAIVVINQKSVADVATEIINLYQSPQ
jgi:broad-specificity NMP kinase